MSFNSNTPEGNRYVLAFASLKLAKELVGKKERNNAAREISNQLIDLMGVVLAPTLEAMWEIPGQKLLGEKNGT